MGRIKNILNYKKSSFWIVLFSIVLVVGLGFSLISNPKQESKLPILDENQPDIVETLYETEYDSVEINFLSDMIGFKSSTKFETNESPVVGFIDTVLREDLVHVSEEDLNLTNLYEYRIELGNNSSGYSCILYYDDLYDKAYVEKDGGVSEVGTNFARYIDSLLENENIDFNIADREALNLFREHGWTLDYRINTLSDVLGNIHILSDFYPNTYYYAYNNELSKDIDLDMIKHSNSNIQVDIYRVHESMPEEFYPMKDSRGIVIKSDGEIIGAYISAGRHSTYVASSLEGKSFEEITEKTLNQWLTDMIKADSSEERLATLEPEEIISEYIMALNNKDTKLATYCMSKINLLDSISANILNSELYNKGISLPLTDVNIGAKSNFDNLDSAKLLKVVEIKELLDGSKVFGVTLDLQYKNELTITSGEQYWECHMVDESPQTGWKIIGFGH